MKTHCLAFVPVLLGACSLDLGGTQPVQPVADPPPNASVTADGGTDARVLPHGGSDAAIGTDPDDPCLDSDRDAQCGPVDRDADGVPDDLDRCDLDPNKQDPGGCGCGTPDIDADADGKLDCRDADQCPSDPKKTKPGVCGCGTRDVDADSDDVIDCMDACVGFNDDSERPGCPCDPALETCNWVPKVVLVEPSSDTMQAQQLGVLAEAKDEDGTIQRVTLYIDGKRIRDEKQAPYTWGAASSSSKELQNLAPGMHLVEVEAVDNGGATARASRNVTLVP